MWGIAMGGPVCAWIRHMKILCRNTFYVWINIVIKNVIIVWFILWYNIPRPISHILYPPLHEISFCARAFTLNSARCWLPVLSFLFVINKKIKSAVSFLTHSYSAILPEGIRNFHSNHVCFPSALGVWRAVTSCGTSHTRKRLTLLERERERGALLPGLQTAARLLRTALQHLSDRNIRSVCQMQNFGALVRRAT